MSVIRPRPPEDPLTCHARGGEAAVSGLADRLAAIRAGLVATPVGLDLATRMLAEYDARRPESRLFSILAAARRMRDSIDRLVVVADAALAPATRLLAAACCHPFHDQLARGERGGRPRLSWLDRSSGDDEIQGLLDLVSGPGRTGDDLLDRWAILPVDAPPDDPRLAAILAVLVAPLAAAAGGRERIGSRVVPVAAAGSRLAATGRALGCLGTFLDEPELDSPQGVFTAAGLLPAAVAGIDVVRLLQGAAAMNRRFAEAPVAENPPLVEAAVAVQAAARGRPGRTFLGAGRWVAEFAAWHGRLRPAPPGAAGLVAWLGSGAPRRDRLVLSPHVVAVGGPAAEGAGPEWAAGPPPLEPDLTIGLPRVDEHAIGQLLQSALLAAAVEARLREGV